MVANDVLAAFDDTGMPYFYGAVFPTGVYSEVTANGYLVGAVRSDGAAVVIPVPPGSGQVLMCISRSTTSTTLARSIAPVDLLLADQW